MTEPTRSDVPADDDHALVDLALNLIDAIADMGIDTVAQNFPPGDGPVSEDVRVGVLAARLREACFVDEVRCTCGVPEDMAGFGHEPDCGQPADTHSRDEKQELWDTLRAVVTMVETASVDEPVWLLPNKVAALAKPVLARTRGSAETPAPADGILTCEHCELNFVTPRPPDMACPRCGGTLTVWCEKGDKWAPYKDYPLANRGWKSDAFKERLDASMERNKPILNKLREEGD